MLADFQRVKDLFLAALEREEPAERDALLNEACGADEALRRQVNDLLLRHEEAGSFLQQPALLATAAPTDLGDRGSAETPGTRIGPYKLLQLLGEGGMGTVWLAEQQESVQRRVALKVIKPGLDSQRVLARFEQERQALAVMDHPNIAKVLDAGSTASGRPYFVMELVKGVPITKYCDQEHLSPRERLELFIPVCQAVQHAHQKGIIHRDLKPSNVLIALYDSKPVPKVIDFGVAKAISQKLTERTLFTEVGQIIGTLEYMAPEQAELNNLDIDTRADIYALGVILYELLTGSTPFTRQQLRSAAFTEMLRLIRDVEPPKLTSTEDLANVAAKRKLEPKRLAQLVRGDLDWIVMKCLEKERNRRYETANALALEVKRYLHDEPVLAGPPGAGYRLGKFVRRNRGPVLAAVAIVLALVGGIAGTTWGLVKARRQSEAANVSREEAVRQQRRAEEESSIARAVNDFLQKDLLGQADVANQPAGAAERDPNVTVRELLDRAAATVEGRFASQPLTEAAIRQTLGNAYTALGRYAEAEQQLDRSVELRDAQLGPDDLDTLSSKHDLGALLLLQRKDNPAELLFREIVVARTAQLGADHPDTLMSKLLLGTSWRTNREKYVHAERLYREIIAACTAKLGATHPLTLRGKSHLAMLYQVRADYARAEPLHLEIIAGRTATLGADHPETLFNKHNLAVLWGLNMGKLAQGEALFQEVIAARTAKLGADHPDTLTSKYGLAGIYQRQPAKVAQAEALFQEVLAGRTAKLGPNNPFTQVCRSSLAHLYSQQGKNDQAEQLFRQLLTPEEQQRRTAVPSDNKAKATLAGLSCNFGMVLAANGKEREAQKAFEKALELAPTHVLAHNNLAWLQATGLDPRVRNTARAVELAQAAVRLAPQVGFCWNTLAVAHYRAGDWKAALAALDKSMALRNGGDSLDWFIAAMAHARLGQKAKARAWYAKAVQWDDQHQSGNDELRRFRAEAAAVLSILEKKSEPHLSGA